MLLEVLCSSVNPTDTGTDSYLKPKPLGSDVVGRVVSVASDSAKFKVSTSVTTCEHTLALRHTGTPYASQEGTSRYLEPTGCNLHPRPSHTTCRV